MTRPRVSHLCPKSWDGWQAIQRREMMRDIAPGITLSVSIASGGKG